MKYREWLVWFNSLPWKFRWFVILILLRPLIDLAWDMKMPVFAASPLQIIGLLTPLIIFLLFLSGQLTIILRTGSVPARLFFWWSILICVNAVLITVMDPDVDRIAISLKIGLPVYLYFFFRHFIRSRAHLDGILTTVLYSAVFPALMLTYEVLFSPIKTQVSRGLLRYEGGYADVANYGFYILFSTLIAGYFWLQGRDKSRQGRKITYWIFMILGICSIGLLKINHAASYFTFGALFMLFLFYSMKKGLRGIFLALFLVFIAVGTFINFKAHEQIVPLVQTDIHVLEGEVDPVLAFHGRMGRWERHWDYFRDEISFVEQLFGFIGISRPYMASAGAHNDYLRILYSTGFVGLILYILLLAQIFLSSRHMPESHQFLVKGMLTIMLLMSISTTPTFYVIVNYTFIPLLAFIVLPKSSER